MSNGQDAIRGGTTDAMERRASLLMRDVTHWLLPTLLALVATGCGVAPPADRPGSTAVESSATRDTALGRAVAPPVEAHPGDTGIRLIADPLDAFATWMRLVREAERSVDLQYYIWDDDVSGTLMLTALREAADRGVRVRLLLDDLGTRGMDETLAALDAQENIEVRLFNPFTWRSGLWWLGFLTDFTRANRRMHDKVLVADNQVAIVGGRNISDTYFGASRERLFLDLDVLTTGPVVAGISTRFDRFWASPPAWSLSRVIPDAAAGTPATVSDTAATRRYRSALAETDLEDALTGQDSTLVWVPATVVGDAPEKGMGIPLAREDLLT